MKKTSFNGNNSKKKTAAFDYADLLKSNANGVGGHKPSAQKTSANNLHGQPKARVDKFAKQDGSHNGASSIASFDAKDKGKGQAEEKDKSFFKNLLMKVKSKKFQKKAAIVCGILIVVGLLGAAGVFAYFAKDLPDPNKLIEREMAQSTKILARDGTQLYEVHGEVKRTLVGFDQMPESIKEATIATEDKDFYRHRGFSIVGITRSAFNDIFKHKGEAVAGGSTITQQLIKNTVLTNEKTFTRKIKELILSIEMERKFSKDDILKLYLNEIPYGSNAYGVEAAAQTFFGKQAKDLTLTESAYLAALPKAPTYYSPYGGNADQLEERKNYVLDRMRDEGYITAEEADKAKAEKITFSAPRENIIAPHFVMYVKEQLAEKYGEKALEEGGFVVTTSLDMRLQKIAEEEVAKAAAENESAYNASNAALVAVDPKTGQILAMVGSRDYFDTDHDGNVNVANRDRQPGSSIKPYAYAEAFVKGYSPATMLVDVKTDFGAGYSPNNYTGAQYGLTNMRSALAGSLNISSVKTLAMAGLNDTLDLIHRMGITTLNDPDRFGLSMVLGGGEVKLVDHTAAFGVFANGGLKQPKTPFLKIEKNGKIEEEWHDQGEQVLDAQVAYLINNVLSDNTARYYIFGAYSPLTLSDRPVAAKTGTTQEFRDAWTVGFTPSLAAGVWAGNNDNSPMVYGADGVVVAAPLWHAFMERALEGTEPEEFPRPEGIRNVIVDAVSGKLPTNSTPSTKSEVFASSNAPTEPDNVHVKVKIDKASGKLATDLTPPGYVEEKTFTIVHSEMPDNPAWEGPVQAWAAGQGYTYPPSESDDVHVPSNKPSIQIISPSSGQTVSTLPLTISTNASAPRGITRVEFYFDGNMIDTATSLPFETFFNSSVSQGQHNISAKAFDGVGNEAETSISVNFNSNLGDLSLTAPTNGQVVSFPFVVKALTSDNSVEEVEFYYASGGNQHLIGSDASSQNVSGSYQYSVSWSSNPGSGFYSIFAIAYYAGGATIQTAPVTIQAP